MKNTADKISKILVVDDEKGVQDLLRSMFEVEGFEVVVANDGIEGVELVKKDSFVVVFLDVHMPKMQGPEALKAIKNIRPNQAVVILSSSSDSNLTFEKEAKNLGALACLYKPVDIEEIMRIVREI